METKIIYYGSELYHHGVKGQKWGERQWQNQDGSLTPAGRVHYGYGPEKQRMKDSKSKLRSLQEQRFGRDSLYGIYGRMTKKGRQLNKDIKSAKADYKQAKKDYKNTDEYKRGTAKYTMKKNFEYNQKYDEIDGNKSLQKWDNFKKTITGKQTIGQGIDNAAKINKKAAAAKNALSKERLKETTVKGQAKTAALLGAAGLATYAVGKLVENNSYSNGAKYVAAFLQGAGQGMAISGIVGGGIQTAKDAYDKSQMNKKK